MNVAQMDERIGDLDIASYDGTLTWKITDYEKRKRDARIGKTKHLSSQPFYTDRQGYKMRGHIFLNGDGTGRKIVDFFD